VDPKRVISMHRRAAEFTEVFFLFSLPLRRRQRKITMPFGHQTSTILTQSVRNFYFRFFSKLVEEGLVNFQCKVSHVMKTIGLTFNDLDFVIHPFQFASMDGILTMVQDAIAMAFEHVCEAVQSTMI